MFTPASRPFVRALTIAPVVLIATLALGLLTPNQVALAEPSVIHVSPDGDDGAAGTEAAPFASLQAAVDHLGATAGTIHLAAGTYTSTAATVSLEGADLAIIGVCAGGAPTSILEGDGAASVLDVAAGAAVQVECVTLTQGGGFAGGGLSNTGTTTLRRAAVTENQADFFGGGIAQWGGSLTLDDVTVTENEATMGGGGLYSMSTLHMRNSVIADNVTPGDMAGGLLHQSGEAVLDHVEVTRNSAPAGPGGGLYVSGPLTMVGGEVSDNVGSEGGGIAVVGGGAAARGVLFDANSGTGAHVHVEFGSADLEWNYWNDGAGLAPGDVTEAHAPVHSCPTATCEATLTLAFDEGSNAGTVGLALSATDAVFDAYEAMRTELDPEFSLFTPSATCDSEDAPCDRMLPLGMIVSLSGPGGAVSTSWDGCANTVTVTGDTTCTATLAAQLLMRLASTGDEYPTLQDALDAAGPGDTVELAATEYAGTAVTISQDVNIVGVCDADGPALSVLRPSGSSRIMTVQAGATVSVECVRFTGATANEAGGAIFNAGDLALDRVEVTGNTSTHIDGGGGIRNQGEATLRIRNSEVTDNTATAGRGGGIYVFGSAGEGGVVVIEDSVIAGNTSDFGGGISLYGLLGGGGAPIGPLVVLRDSTVESNQADGGNPSTGGGGIHNQWARVYASNSVIQLNHGYSGGGINNDGALWLLDTDVILNDAAGNGGGIVNNRVLVMLGGSVADNQANGDGGGLATFTNSQALRGVTLEDNNANASGDLVYGALDFPDEANFALAWNYWPSLQPGDISWQDVTAPPAGQVCADAVCRTELDLVPGAGGTLTLQPFVADYAVVGAARVQFLHQLHAASVLYAVGSDEAPARIGTLVQAFPPDLGLPALPAVGDGACADVEGCTLSLPLGTTYTVSAAAHANYEFGEWTGPGCVASDGDTRRTDRVDLATATECGALFNALGFTLDVFADGTGDGAVESEPVGIDCPGDCAEVYAPGTEVTLTATASVGSTFAGWSGDADCADGTVTMSAGVSCTATFELDQYDLTVDLAGDGVGTATSDPAGIDCGDLCEASFGHGTDVTLTAAAAPGSIFSGWTGEGCASADVSIELTMMGGVDCTATFTLPASYVTLTTLEGATEAEVEAGGTIALRVTVFNEAHEPLASLDGAQTVVLSGLSPSPDGDAPVIGDGSWDGGDGELTVELSFAGGVASAELEVFDAALANVVATTQGVDSSAFALTVTHAAGDRLEVETQQSASAVAGAAFATQPRIEVLDAYGNLVTTGPDAAVAVSALGDGTLSGDITVDAANGIAAFTDLAVLTAGGGQVLEFSATLSAGVRNVNSAAFTVAPGEPATLVVLVEPAGVGAGELEQQPAVEVRDAHGNTVTVDPDGAQDEAVEVSIEDGPPGAVLGGTAEVAVDWATGRASFTDLALDRPGNYTLVFTPTSAWGGAGFPLEAVASQEFTLAAAALTDVSVAPYQARAGNSQGLVIRFTTATPVPVGGSFTITLPAGFSLEEHEDGYCLQVGSDCFAPNSVSIDGLAATFVFPNPVAAGSVVQMGPMLGVTNPVASGLTGTYHLETHTAEGVLLDAAIAPGTTITAGDLARFEVAVNEGGPVVAGEAFSIVIRAFDAWDNVYDGTGEITLSFSTDAGPAPRQGWEAEVPEEAQFRFEDGEVGVDGFEVYDAGETPSITVTMVGEGVSGDSAPVEVIPGSLDPASATIATSHTSRTTAQTAMITARLFDWLGNAMESGGEAVTLTTSRGSLGAMTDRGDGTYQAALSSSTAGDAIVSGEVNGTAITTGDVTVAFSAAPRRDADDRRPREEPQAPTPQGDVIEEAGQVLVPIGARAEAPVLPDEPASVESTTGPSSVRVTVPPGSLSEEDAGRNLRLEVAAVEDIDDVTEQAPPPAESTVVSQFVVRLVDDEGNTYPASFREPASIELTVPADDVPQDADLQALVLVFWNGQTWLEVAAVAAANADGSVTLRSEVMHFTLFSVIWAPPRWGAFTPEPAASGITLARWQGGSWSRLDAALERGARVWVFIDGRPAGYTVGAPAFVNAAFVALHPDGLPAGSLSLVAP